MNQPPLEFWSLPAAELLAQLQTTPQGITGDEAKQRLTRYGSNLLTLRKSSHYPGNRKSKQLNHRFNNFPENQENYCYLKQKSQLLCRKFSCC